MIVDTSAILTVAFNESLADRFFDALSAPGSRRISAANLIEAYMVVDRRDDSAAIESVEEAVARFDLIVEPVTREHVAIARDAWNRFGKGSGSVAQLNFGDCFAYALAKERDEPLLFIGNDFTHTDIRPVL